MNAKILIQRFDKKEKVCGGGSLRFFGNWFGKPYDNYHVIKKMTYEEYGKCLVLTFDENEKLRVWSPQEIFMDELKLTIKTAKRVRWEWFYYGRPQASNNLYFEDFEHTLLGFKAKSNVDWYKPVYTNTLGSNAVDLIKGIDINELPDEVRKQIKS